MNIKAKKSLGQNFLQDETILKRIADSIKTNENDLIIEIGPGKVLAGLNKKISSELNTLNIYDFESLNSVVAEIKEKELV